MYVVLFTGRPGRREQKLAGKLSAQNNVKFSQTVCLVFVIWIVENISKLSTLYEVIKLIAVVLYDNHILCERGVSQGCILIKS